MRLASLLPPRPERLSDLRLVRHQGPMLKTLARTAALAVGQKLGPPLGRRPPSELPGPEVVQTVPPRDPELVSRYLQHLGAEPSTWGQAVPNHLFPQWTFPALAKTLERIPYPLGDLLNGGATMRSRAPLPMGESLTSRARLMRIDDDGRRAIMHQALTTGTPSAPDALEVEFRAIVRLRSRPPSGRDTGKHEGRDEGRAGREKPTVPEDALEIGRWALGPSSGLEFALLTGDFNPIHWVPVAARAAGFKNTILHGFASMARAAEALGQRLGSPQALSTLDVRFVQPLVLPRFHGDPKGVGSIGCYVRDQEVFVGTSAGGPAFMVGTFAAR